MFFPEKKFDNENYYYYEILPLTTCSSINQGETERSNYDTSFSQKANFDCLSFMVTHFWRYFRFTRSSNFNIFVTIVIVI